MTARFPKRPRDFRAIIKTFDVFEFFFWLVFDTIVLANRKHLDNVIFFIYQNIFTEHRLGIVFFFSFFNGLSLRSDKNRIHFTFLQFPPAIRNMSFLFIDTQFL